MIAQITTSQKWLLIMIIAILAPLPTFAQQDVSPKQPSSQAQLNPSVVYYRDPETGELTTPPANVMRTLQPDAINFSDEGLEVITLADGTKMIDLQGRFQMSATIKPKPDGTFDHHCTSHPHTLNAQEHSESHTSHPDR